MVRQKELPGGLIPPLIDMLGDAYLQGFCAEDTVKRITSSLKFFLQHFFAAIFLFGSFSCYFKSGQKRALYRKGESLSFNM